MSSRSWEHNKILTILLCICDANSTPTVMDEEHDDHSSTIDHYQRSSGHFTIEGFMWFPSRYYGLDRRLCFFNNDHSRIVHCTDTKSWWNVSRFETSIDPPMNRYPHPSLESIKLEFSHGLDRYTQKMQMDGTVLRMERFSTRQNRIDNASHPQKWHSRMKREPDITPF